MLELDQLGGDLYALQWSPCTNGPQGALCALCSDLCLTLIAVHPSNGIRLVAQAPSTTYDAISRTPIPHPSIFHFLPFNSTGPCRSGQ